MRLSPAPALRNRWHATRRQSTRDRIRRSSMPGGWSRPALPRGPWPVA